jgi:hypothetical protein
MAYISTILITDSVFINIDADKSILVFVDSDVNITDSNIQNLHSTKNGIFVSSSFGSNLLISNMNMIDSDVQLLLGLSSEINLDMIFVDSIIMDSSLISLID